MYSLPKTAKSPERKDNEMKTLGVKKSGEVVGKFLEFCEGQIIQGIQTDCRLRPMKQVK